MKKFCGWSGNGLIKTEGCSTQWALFSVMECTDPSASLHTLNPAVNFVIHKGRVLGELRGNQGQNVCILWFGQISHIT